MKKLLLGTLLLLSTLSFAQKDFKWEKIDSVAKTKTQIYADTKMYIAQKWNSAQDVIQLDDKEVGSILIKASIKESITYGVHIYTYYYHYTITFLMKDNKFKIVLDNVNCNTTSATYNLKFGYPPCLQPFEGENYPDVGSVWSQNIPKKKQIILMKQLKTDLHGIVDSYIATMKGGNILTEKW